MKQKYYEYHPIIHYVLSNCGICKREVARRLHTGPKTLRAWETQSVIVWPETVVKVSHAAEFPLIRVPMHLIASAIVEDIRRIRARHEEALQINQFIDEVTS